MKNSSTLARAAVELPRRCFLGAALAVFLPSAAAAEETFGPSSSLLGPPNPRRPLTLARDSWTHWGVGGKVFELHSIVSVLISEQSTMISEGEMDRKKKAHGDLILKDWVLLKGLSLVPDPQSAGDPHIRGEVDNKYRAESEIELRDSLKGRITCTVVDIRPNGNLVLEGHDTITINSEVWDFSLQGVIRPQDVSPNNTVLSENILYKRIYKRQSGHVRDGWRRGWLLKILDKIQLF